MMESHAVGSGGTRVGRDNMDAGFAGVGALLLFAVAMVAFLFVCEFIFIIGAKENLEIELARAANIAVDLAMSDAHRQDHISELDAAAAHDQFYDYLFNDMRLSPQLEAYSHDGGCLYKIEITDLFISASPPVISATAVVTMQPLFIGRAAPELVRFNIRASSVNRRND